MTQNKLSINGEEGFWDDTEGKWTVYKSNISHGAGGKTANTCLGSDRFIAISGGKVKAFALWKNVSDSTNK